MTVIGYNAFEMNCKTVYNDTAIIHQRVMRMWASAENPGDFELLDGLQDKLESILYLLKNRLES